MLTVFRINLRVVASTYVWHEPSLYANMRLKRIRDPPTRDLIVPADMVRHVSGICLFDEF